MIQKAVTWVMWTPARAIGTLVAALFLAFVAFVLIGSARQPATITPGAEQTTTQAAPSGPFTPLVTPGTGTGTGLIPTPLTAAPSTSTPAASSPAADNEADPGPAVRRTATTAATRFATGWLAGRTAKDTGTWVRSLRPVTDPQLEPFLSVTNRAAIPAGKPGRPTVRDITAQSAVVWVPVGEWDLALTLAWDGRRWLVTDYRESR